jgi:hypothetical protein
MKRTTLLLLPLALAALAGCQDRDLPTAASALPPGAPALQQVGTSTTPGSLVSWGQVNDTPTGTGFTAVAAGLHHSVAIQGVSKLAQTIDFTAPATHGRQDGNFTITASASSGLTVSFTNSTTAVCTVTDHGDGTATVSNLSVGDCVVVASQAGNANYTATAPVERTIQIVQGGGEIGFCTPGYWQGGAGSQRWNVANDPGWGGFHAQPYTHASAFFGRTNPYTSPFSRNRIPTADIPNSMTMFDIVSTGGSSNSAQRAARSVIAAYLNASSKQEGAGYPLTSAVIVSRWNTAANISNAAQRDAALDALHLELDAHNNGFDCR